MRTVIQGGTVVTATDTFGADVWIEGDRIVGVVEPGRKLENSPADKTIDARGKFIMPGGIDAHTHLDMPFGGTQASDDFETGTRAAAFGGTTCVVDFAIQGKGQSLRQGLDIWHARAEGKTAIDYAFHLIVTDATDAVIHEMDKTVQEGVSSFKLFMAYPGSLMSDDGQILRSMQRAREVGALIQMHAENGAAIDVLVKQALAAGHTAPKYHALTRPEVCEAEATYRTMALAEIANTPVYIVHLSTPRALREVVRAQADNRPVFAETCPQYLFASLDDISREGFEGAKFVCSPPMRAKEGQKELWDGIRKGSLSVVATDHCPFHMKGQKEMGKASFDKIPNGMPGIETRMSMMWDGGVRNGRISMNRFVQITSTEPAKIFGLYPRKGTVAVGADADLLVWDPKREVSLDASALHMRVDYSPFEGQKVLGGPSQVLSRGKVIVDGNAYLGRAGDGRFIKRAPFETKAHW